LVALAGCAPIAEPRGVLGQLWRLEVGPHYERPSVDSPEDFRGRIGPEDAASFADLPWWEVFGDPVLRHLVTQSLTGNYDLLAAVARIEQARAQVGIAASDLYPQIGYEGAAQRQRGATIPGGPTVPSTRSSAPSTRHGRSMSGAAFAAPRKPHAHSSSPAKRPVVASSSRS